MPDATSQPGEVALLAGPPPPSPPVFIAFILIALGLIAPFLFLRAGAPGPLLGLATLAIAAAGIITLFGAIAAQQRRNADPAIRKRASITPAGITLHPQPTPAADRHFLAADIAQASLLGSALILQAGKSHPQPGRHVLRFGKLASPRAPLIAALALISQKV